MALSPKWYQFLVSMFASLGSFLFGYDLGVIAEVITSGNFLTKFDNPSAAQTGAVVALFTAGAFFGAAGAGPCGDWLGRRITIMIGALIFILGGSLQTGAQTLGFLYSGRFFAGLGVGFLTMCVPMYQAELAHPDIRGRVTSLQQFMLGVGALCAAWISYGTAIGFSNDDSAQWRLALGIQIIPAVFLAALILLFPESPRWLIYKGRSAEGIRNLAKLHSNGNEKDPYVLAEYAQIQESIEKERDIFSSYKLLVSKKSNLRRVFIAMALQASIQMTGVSAIQYYSVSIYAQIGIGTDDALKYQAINSIIALLGELSCMLFIDYVGRRPALIGGNLGNMVAFIVATALLAQFPPTAANTGAHWGFIIMTWLYNFTFSATCGPLSWIIPAEIFDFESRSAGVSAATMMSFAFNTLIGQVTPIALVAIGWKYYLVFVVCNLTNAIFFWAVLPETKKIPLEEMHDLFTDAPLFVPAWKPTKRYGQDLDTKIEEIAGGKEVTLEHVEQVNKV